MFKLNQNYEVDHQILKFDYRIYSHAEVSTINTPNSQTHIIIPRETSVISLLNSHLDLSFEGVKKTDNSTYAKSSEIKLVKRGSIALFSNVL